MVNLVRGAGTGVPLGNVTPLLLPWARDPWGALRPPVSVEAMRLSAELAAATYHMDIEPWVQAGWRDVTIQVEINVKYEGYIKRQETAAAQFRKMEKRKLPEDFDYSAVPNLSLEAREKLTKTQPESIGQAGRISGVSPADVTALMVYFGRKHHD